MKSLQETSLLALAAHAVQAFASNPVTVADMLAQLTLTDGPKGLAYAPVPERFLTLEAQGLKLRASGLLNLTMEFELIQVVGPVRPHYHKDSSGAIIRLNTEPDEYLDGIFGFLPERSTHEYGPVPPGRMIIIPRLTVHGFEPRSKGPVHFLSVNIPPLDDGDIHYV